MAMRPSLAVSQFTIVELHPSRLATPLVILECGLQQEGCEASRCKHHEQLNHTTAKQGRARKAYSFADGRHPVGWSVAHGANVQQSTLLDHDKLAPYRIDRTNVQGWVRE